MSEIEKNDKYDEINRIWTENNGSVTSKVVNMKNIGILAVWLILYKIFNLIDIKAYFVIYTKLIFFIFLPSTHQHNNTKNHLYFQTYYFFDLKKTGHTTGSSLPATIT